MVAGGSPDQPKGTSHQDQIATSKSCGVYLKRHSAHQKEPGFTRTTLISCELQTGNGRGDTAQDS